MHAFCKSGLHEQLVAILVAKHKLISTGCRHLSFFVFILFCGASCAGTSVRSCHKTAKFFFLRSEMPVVLVPIYGCCLMSWHDEEEEECLLLI